MASERGLEASDLTYSYGRNQVVKGVSLSLPPGRALALTGPNGSGKTTVLRMLSGALMPETGTVSLAGTNLRSLGPRAVAQRIAVVPQHVDPFLSLLVQEVVSFGRTPYTRWWGAMAGSDRHAVDNAMELTGVTSLRRARFSELSGGEQQRVSLAMALAQDTNYLLLDEPTVHLDLHHQHALLELLAKLKAAGSLTVLAVMHDLNLAALYFDEIAVLQHGLLVALDTPDRILGSSATMSVFGAPLRTLKHPQTGVTQIVLERGESSR